jgi:hypothetical protein
VEQLFSSITSMDLGMFFQISFFVGVIFMVITALFGFDHSAEIDHDFDHGVDHDMDHDIDHDFDHGHDILGPGFLSIKMIAAYLTGFGGGGWIAYEQYNQPPYICVISGIGGAMVLGIIAYYIIKLFLSQQTKSGIPKTTDFIDSEGVISTSIPEGEDKVGQILVTVKGAKKYCRAMSFNGKEINKGTEVIIVEMKEGKVVVKKK